MPALRYFSSILIVFTLVFWGSSVGAHPLGNFTINHYTGLELHPDGVAIDYVLDMAEIPAFQTIRHQDHNQNGVMDPDEAATFQPEACAALQSDLSLALDQQPQSIALETSTLDFPPGVGGLSTLRLNCQFNSAFSIAEDTQHQLTFTNRAYAQRLGWREMTLQSPEIPIQSTLKSASLSNRLQHYPDDLLNSPADQRQATITLWPSAPESTQPETHRSPRLAVGSVSIDRGQNPLAQWIHLEDLTPMSIVVGLLVAFVWGGFHALTPGHGKTVVGAYLVGSKGTPQHALLLGLTTTITHTAGIFALGILTLAASQFVVTEQIYPWLSAISGLMVIGIGITLFQRRLVGVQTHIHHAHDHPHHHAHNHSHETHHPHKPHHSHEPNHTHHADHAHHSDPISSHKHSHHPKGPATWGSLIALGISGGLLPCPTALVMLLSAIALGRVGLGLALVTSFSLGLAVVLTGVGLLLIFARQQVDKLPLEMPPVRFLPSMSAAFIALVGVAITTQALMQTGILPFGS